MYVINRTVLLTLFFIIHQLAFTLPLVTDDSLDSLISVVLGSAYQAEEPLLEQDYFFKETTVTEHPFVIIICSYNNAQWSENTLNSIFLQNYHNFRVIIVDDCSSDNNADVIQNYIDNHNIAHRVTFIRNEKRMRKLSNLYKVLYMCADDEIVLMIDGDDWLDLENKKNILQLLNSYYEDPHVWFTYGQYRNVPAHEAIKWGFKEIGYCREVPERIREARAYRKYPFIYMHPRSFRAWLFKLVKLEDLIAEYITGFEGDFYPAANDVAMYFPMVEMAHRHIRFIADILYIRNLYSDIVGFKVDKTLQIASAREIRKKPLYPILNKPLIRDLEKYKREQADFFLICHSFESIGTTIANIKQYVDNINILYIFYQGTERNKNNYHKIKKRFNEQVIFVSYDQTDSFSLKQQLTNCLVHSTQGYIVLAQDGFTVTQPIALSSAIYWLERTRAERFYLGRSSLDATVPRFVTLDADICAWKFLVGKDKWHGITTLTDIPLCKKAKLIGELNALSFTTADDLAQEISCLQASLSKVGLFFKDEKIKNS